MRRHKKRCSTTLAFVLALLNGANGEVEFRAFNLDEALPVGFLIALMGWMPTAVDLSSWNSLWTLERIKQTNFKPTLNQTIFEFNIGYLSSAFLSMCFLTLGAYLMYGTENNFSNSSAIFANQVITL